MANNTVIDGDIRGMTLGELKNFLEKKGVPCKDCVQKEDFVEIALSVKDHSDVESKEPEKTGQAQSAPSGATSSEATKKEMKDVILEHLNHFTVLAIKYGQEYSVRAQAITVDIFNRAAGFTAESAKIYGPKAQELFKVYSALLKEQGIRHGKWAFKQANVYGKLGLEYGKIWSKKALKKFQELGHAAVDRVDKFLESRREKAKKEL